ncbi:MAG: CPBP family intramembrane metalloprotease, partial [Halobacteriovoraceae bacterium]|nr:CPBP family intramembrane metalloprotease [Halobacteriovoraceae bacterium]
LQLLLLAPLIEELVFREGFVALFEKFKLNKILILSLNSILFSLSHLPALWHLPVEFHSFIAFQVFYTLILGWICTKVRIETKGLALPIIHHFLFNLIFYVALKMSYI